MNATIEVQKQQEMFTEYPKAMEEFFQNRTIMIKKFPVELSAVAEDEFPEFRVSSAKQYFEYLNQEISFWQENDSKKVLEPFSYQSRLVNARTNFNNALNAYKAAGIAQGNQSMTNSINAINPGALYSKTQLTKAVLGYKSMKPEFLFGLKVGLQGNSNTSPGTGALNLEGFFAGLSYRGLLREKIKLTRKNISDISENVATANENYAQLNLQYTNAFTEQESRIKSIHSQTETKLRELDKEAEKQLIDIKMHFAELETKYSDNFTALEKNYSEHLKLEEPAKYWKEMDAECTKKGRIWLGVSIVWAQLIIGALIVTLAMIPNIFSEQSHWMDVIKNSAIITVVTSIAVYLLRVLIKLSMSSFHLSRDAKERNKLSYFYLALIHESAVTDKERAIVLNALFSRSDTGLLKGDATPAMSNNVAELVDTLRK